MSVFVYGIVTNNIFHSDNMEIKVDASDGIYCIDVESDDYLDSIEYADMDKFINYVKKSKKMRFAIGFSYKNGIIPQNMIKWGAVPIPVVNNLSDDWEVIKVINFNNKFLYYIDTIYSDLYMKLAEVKERFDSKSSIDDLKGITPEMRVLYQLEHLDLLAKEKERKRKTFDGLKESLSEIADLFGGKITSVIKHKHHYEIKWSHSGFDLITTVDNNFSVIKAGFCVSGEDKKHSFRSIISTFNNYINEDQGIHKTVW